MKFIALTFLVLIATATAEEENKISLQQHTSLKLVDEHQYRPFEAFLVIAFVIVEFFT